MTEDSMQNGGNSTTLHETAKRTQNKRNIVLASMLASMFLGYLPWYNFSAVSHYIAKDLGLTVSQTGFILSSFQAGYVIIVLLTGWLADRIGNRTVVAWATLLTAISSTLFSFLARDFASVLFLRLVTGLAAGAIYVPGVALLSGWFEPEKRSGAIGAYTGALALAYSGGYFIAAPIAAAYTWRHGMFFTSIPAFLAAFLVFAFAEDAPLQGGMDEVLERNAPLLGGMSEVPEMDTDKVPERNATIRGDIGKASDHDTSAQNEAGKSVGRNGSEQSILLAKNRKSLGTKHRDLAGPVLITAGYMGHMWELYAFWGWIGPFMVACARAVGHDTVSAVALGGRLAAFVILLGAPSVWLAGLAADRIGRNKTIVICAVSSLAAQFIFGRLYGRSLALVLIAGLWIGFWVAADSSIYKAGMTVMVSPSVRGTALGIQSALGFSVTIVSPYVFGQVLALANPGISDTSQAAQWGLPFAVLGIGALLAPLSVAGMRYYERKAATRKV